MTRRHHVVVVGGGIGALEATLALRSAAGATIRITLVAPEPCFTYEPWAVTEPFADPSTTRLDLRKMADHLGIALELGTVIAVDGDGHRVTCASGTVIAFDSLILALGARPTPVVDGAFTFLGAANAAQLRALLDESALRDSARVAFVTTVTASWNLPAYELALLTAHRAACSGRSVSPLLVTAERAPLEAFGPANSEHVRSLLAAKGVELFTETIPEVFDGASLYVPMAGSIPADVAVALPGLVGRPPAGLPHDERGFVEVDDAGRVMGLGDVYAVGDMTARETKQGGLAAQQADVAAAAVARDAGQPIAVPAYQPVLRAMLLTGKGPFYMRYPPPPGPSFEGPGEPAWWPPHKVAALHLGPYLATHAGFLVQESSHA